MGIHFVTAKHCQQSRVIILATHSSNNYGDTYIPNKSLHAGTLARPTTYSSDIVSRLNYVGQVSLPM